VGVWTRRTGDGCDGWQLSLGGSIVGQFDLDTPSRDLISSDFQIGAPLTLRRGPLSARLRVDHRSSHLGDEFLLNNPEVDPENLSYESAELLVSWDVRPEDAAGVRFYGGGGSIFHSRPHLDGGFVKWGVELRGAVHLLSAAVAVVPVVGADFGAVQQRSWRVTQSFVIGPELRVADSSRRMRILAGYLRGFLPYGPFFEAGRLEEYGITIQLDL
jgi:hypothetical protein